VRPRLTSFVAAALAVVLCAASAAARPVNATEQDNAAQPSAAPDGQGVPWTDPWLVGASAGIPWLHEGLGVVLDGTLGYNARRWGLSARGGASVFDAAQTEYSGRTLRTGGNADVWLAAPIGGRTQLELRSTLDATLFDTNSELYDPRSLSLIAYGKERSWLFRGGALLGLRSAWTGWAVGAWLGGGVQFERYSASAHDPVADPQHLSNDTVGPAFEARLRAQCSVLSGELALRFALDAKTYELTRLARGYGAGTFIELDTEVRQIEGVARLFLDLEAWRMYEFVPAVGLGLDHYRLAVAGQHGPVSTTPVLLVSVRRSLF
jgi:hypothetical protein